MVLKWYPIPKHNFSWKYNLIHTILHYKCIRFICIDTPSPTSWKPYFLGKLVQRVKRELRIRGIIHFNRYIKNNVWFRLWRMNHIWAFWEKKQSFISYCTWKLTTWRLWAHGGFWAALRAGRLLNILPITITSN